MPADLPHDPSQPRGSLQIVWPTVLRQPPQDAPLQASNDEMEEDYWKIIFPQGEAAREAAEVPRSKD
ncbi:MAG: hypothetical protein K8R87_11375 [Verrucomicrobia bacterium]|nr:hypothetical protein [Verrucomicrobiota bacterium]